MNFATRQDAGAKLGAYLAGQHLGAEVILGLPRGGVIVATEVATLLGLPLDAINVRKIGHPRFREFAVGALAENEITVLDGAAIAKSRVNDAELQAVIAEEKSRLEIHERQFHAPVRPALENRTVLIVDDGLATGSTMEAAVLSVKKSRARTVFVAIPVASESGVERIERVADRVMALIIDPAFDAVGHYYEHFNQTTDEEAIAAINPPATTP